ncbi:biogenesis of lysosome-related organelles complex 1 subunit 4 [Cygnus olor]|uniref:biogenesis of lysosome-related organelles complex 1 subunit 4 n=1 Tax=Cygnus atratus TaxID=8868 RepID=UPI0015D59963|nr:biogenesis of lysosome-related organelles complex 1 subunit 4 [Cygnus atratus]XP_040405373.1 biogenesis of lysosome-related organelles complex 1 subunit 4 [Cygnus olor]
MAAPAEGPGSGGMAAASGDGDGAGAGPCPRGDSGDSGHVSQSHSNASGLGEQEDEEGDALEASLSATAAAYAAYLLVDRSAFSEQVESLEKSLDDLLTRVDEFVGMLDMIRSDSSQVINESIPEIYAKATEMRQVYKKIDNLEAFVKMIGNCVAGMEERVIKAETDLGAFPSTFKKILHTISMPSFLNKSSSSRQQTLYEPPVLFKTEDYFPCLNEAPY